MNNQNNAHNHLNDTSIKAPKAARRSITLPPVHEGVLSARVPRRGIFTAGTTAFFALVLAVSISHIGSTSSYFSDVEKSINNTLIADPLYFSVDLATSSDLVDLGNGPQTVVPVMTPGATSDPIQYTVHAVQTGGDSAACSAVSVLSTAPMPFDGPLLAFSAPTTTDVGPWTLHLALVPGVPIATSTSCTADLVYTGWNADSVFGTGYNDTHRVSLTLLVPATVQHPTAPADTTTTVQPDNAQGTTTPVVVTPDAASTTPDTPPASVPPTQDASSTQGTDTPVAPPTPDVVQ